MNRNRFATLVAVATAAIGLAASNGAFAAGQTHHEIRHIEHKMAVHRAIAHHEIHHAVMHHRMAAAHRRAVIHHEIHHMEHHH